MFVAPVFVGLGIERTARRLLIANGLLLPFLVPQLHCHALIWPASLWAITFPGVTWCVALIMRRDTAR